MSHKTSDFGLRVGFPIFLSNCVTWLTSRVEFGQEVLARAGQPLLIDVPRELSEIEVTKPDGYTVGAKIESSPFSFGQTDQVGLYKFAAEGFEAVRAVNLLDKRESDIQPKDTVSVGGQEVAKSETARTSKRELWRYLVLCALAVLCFEWYAYHRRL